MEPIDWDNIGQELQTCHPALMTVWNQYRQQMVDRGYYTVDATQEVALRVLTHRDRFRGQSRSSFCKWTQTILRNWILEKLRRRRPESLASNDDFADHRQDRPSQVFQQELRQPVYDLTRAVISEADRTLIELRFELKLNLSAVSERLRQDYPQLWQENHRAWDTESQLDQACKLARKRFDEEARRIHKLLEGASPDEPDPGK